EPIAEGAIFERQLVHIRSVVGQQRASTRTPDLQWIKAIPVNILRQIRDLIPGRRQRVERAGEGLGGCWSNWHVINCEYPRALGFALRTFIFHQERSDNVVRAGVAAPKRDM